MSGWVVYTEGLRALVRGRYAWFGLAGLMTLVAVMAAFAGVDVQGQVFYLVVAYLVIPSGVATVAAAQFAVPRASKFVQAVFTAPVRRSTYFLANVAVAGTAGAIYLAATLPFLILQAQHITTPPDFWSYLIGGMVLVVYGAAFGSAAGVMFPGRSALPALMVAAFPILVLICVPLVLQGQWVAFEETPDGKVAMTRLGSIIFHVAHLAPHTSILDGLKLWGEEVVHLHPTRMLATLVGTSMALLALAGWTYLRLQGVEDWETTRRKQAVASVAFLLFVALPALSVDADAYRPPSNDLYFADSNRYPAAIVLRPGDSLSQHSPWRWPTFPIHRPVDIEIALWPPLETSGFAVTLAAPPNIRILGAQAFNETGWTPKEFWWNGAPALRIPTRIVIDDAAGLRGNDLRLNVTATFVLPRASDPEAATEESGDGPQARSARGPAFFHAEVGAVATQALALLLVTPALCLGVGAVREWRRR